MADYKLLNLDDWHGLYVNGELYYEGHSIPHFVWLELLGGSELAGYEIEEMDHCPSTWVGVEEILNDTGR